MGLPAVPGTRVLSSRPTRLPLLTSLLCPSRLVDNNDHLTVQPTAEARALIDVANQHQAEKYRERLEKQGQGEGEEEEEEEEEEEVAAAVVVVEAEVDDDEGETDEKSVAKGVDRPSKGQQGNGKKKRKKATGYKKTQGNSEVQFALIGESYSIVFYDRLCFSSLCFHGSAEELRCRLAEHVPASSVPLGVRGPPRTLYGPYISSDS